MNLEIPDNFEELNKLFKASEEDVLGRQFSDNILLMIS